MTPPILGYQRFRKTCCFTIRVVGNGKQGKPRRGTERYDPRPSEQADETRTLKRIFLYPSTLKKSTSIHKNDGNNLQDNTVLHLGLNGFHSDRIEDLASRDSRLRQKLRSLRVLLVHRLMNGKCGLRMPQFSLQFAWAHPGLLVRRSLFPPDISKPNVYILINCA
jgi:hypothetical protein